jgi:hypothetical protein
MHRLFIFEAKKSNASPDEIQELEAQAYQACTDHLIYTDQKHIYAIIVIGTAARLWIVYIKEDYPVP